MTFNFSIFIRVLAATLGGYMVAVASSYALIPLSYWLFSSNTYDGTLLGMMFSFLFYLAAIIWAFCQKTHWLAWRDMLLISSALMTIYLLFLGSL